MNRQRLVAAALFAVLLSACNDDAGPAEGKLSGEVLEGTISDDMLPLDRLRSQAPLAAPDDAPSADASDAAAPTAEAIPQAVETPVTTVNGQTG